MVCWLKNAAGRVGRVVVKTNLTSKKTGPKPKAYNSPEHPKGVKRAGKRKRRAARHTAELDSSVAEAPRAESAGDADSELLESLRHVDFDDDEECY